MKKFSLTMIALLFCCVCLYAQQRSESEAIQIARDFLEKKGQTPRLSVVPAQKVKVQIQKEVALTRKAQTTNTGFYVVNDERNNRFVIVSADERMHEILGYSDNSLFYEDRMPIALLELLYDYERQYYLLCGKDTSSNPNYIGNKTKVSAISPMITSKWGQTEPFNSECPKDKSYSNDTTSVTGCIATAMAQVLNYWKKPNQCFGGTYYYFNPYNLWGTQLLSFNYNNYSINWNNLVDNYNNASEEEKAEVAKLMYACGVSVSMGYSADGSGAWDFDIPYALIKYFNYNPNIVYRNRNYYTDEEWKSMIMNELISGRPILYSGYNEIKRGGHEFILDGCDENGLYHFNFGNTALLYGYLFSGLGDGYFQIDAINPKFLGEDLGDFSYFQSMVCNISPEVVGIHEDTFYSNFFSVIQYGVSYYFQINAQCYSSDANSYFAAGGRFNGKIGIGLFDKDFKFVQSLFSESVSMKSDSLYIVLLNSFEFDMNSLDSNIDFYIAPYALSDGNNIPTRIRALPPEEDKIEGRKVVDSYYKIRNKKIDHIIVYNSITSPDFILGDANGDGIVDVADIVYIVNYIMEKPADDFLFTNADLDSDGVIDVADITLVVNKIMSSASTRSDYSNMELSRLIDLKTLGNGQFALNITGAQQYVASQFDVVVPSTTIISRMDCCTDNHEVIFNKIAPNRYRVISYSLDNRIFKDLLNIKTEGETGGICIENAMFVTKDGKQFYSTPVDSHATGIISIAGNMLKKDVHAIDGRRIESERLSKGIYIINGTKHVVR